MLPLPLLGWPDASTYLTLFVRSYFRALVWFSVHKTCRFIQVLEKLKKYSTHIDFSFPDQKGTGIPRMLGHVSKEAVDLIVKMLAYDPDDRYGLVHSRARTSP